MPRSSRVRRRRYLRKRQLARRRQARVRDVIAKLQAHTNPLYIFPKWFQEEYEHTMRELNADLFRDGEANHHTTNAIQYAQFKIITPRRLGVVTSIESDDDE